MVRDTACDNPRVRTLRLPWLLALPLMVGGSLAAHIFGRGLVPVAGTREHQETGELSGLHERASRGVAGHTVLALGVIVAVAFVLAIYALSVRLGARRRRGLGAGCFFLLPLIAYSSQEFTERLLHAESFPFQAVFEPRFLAGLALQLPFAAAAFALGWLLLRAGEGLVRFLNARQAPRLRALPGQLWSASALSVPRVRALSRGHPLRGPPLLA